MLKMQEEEKIVEQYLRGQGYSNIVFEPHGNTTPDFVVNGDIAIEVRRLNQNYQKAETYYGLKEDGKPLYDLVEELLEKFGEHFCGKTYAVFLEYQRPLPHRREVRGIKNKIKNELNNFRLNPTEQKNIIYSNQNISIEIHPATPKPGIFYFMGGEHDLDSA